MEEAALNIVEDLSRAGQKRYIDKVEDVMEDTEVGIGEVAEDTPHEGLA